MAQSHTRPHGNGGWFDIAKAEKRDIPQTSRTIETFNGYDVIAPPNR